MSNAKALLKPFFASVREYFKKINVTINNRGKHAGEVVCKKQVENLETRNKLFRVSNLSFL